MNLFHRQLTFKNVLGKDVQGRTDFTLSPLLVKCGYLLGAGITSHNFSHLEVRRVA